MGVETFSFYRLVAVLGAAGGAVGVKEEGCAGEKQIY
jgi:hypothetical protein